jgi:hypothetical protein
MPEPVYDSLYNNELAGAQADWETTMAGIGLSRSRLGYDSGFGANGQADLSNSYSQALMLQRSWEQAGRGINNSMAARGQLYSGARQRGQNEANFQYERSRHDLQTSTARGYQDLSLAEQQAGNDRTRARYDASAGQAGRWQDMQRDWFERYGK